MDLSFSVVLSEVFGGFWEGIVIRRARGKCSPLPVHSNFVGLALFSVFLS